MVNKNDFPVGYPLRDEVDRTRYPFYSLTRDPALMLARLLHTFDRYYQAKLCLEEYNRSIDERDSYSAIRGSVPMEVYSRSMDLRDNATLLFRLYNASKRFESAHYNAKPHVTHRSTLNDDIAAALAESDDSESFQDQDPDDFPDHNCPVCDSYRLIPGLTSKARPQSWYCLNCGFQHS
jgi:hypothetical protein